MTSTKNSESDLAVCNYALGYADGLVTPRLRRNQPTKKRYREPFRRGLSDAERRRPFDPAGARADDHSRNGRPEGKTSEPLGLGG